MASFLVQDIICHHFLVEKCVTLKLKNFFKGSLFLPMIWLIYIFNSYPIHMGHTVICTSRRLSHENIWITEENIFEIKLIYILL